MAVTFVGSGAAAWANNASVTPALPGGLQAGDLMLATVYVREDVANVDPPAGWSIARVSRGTSIAAENYAATFYRRYVAGDASPTFVPTGSGSNDTVGARIYAFRGGPSSGNPFTQIGEGSNTSTSINVPPNINSPSPLDSNSMLFAFGVASNDIATQVATSSFYYFTGSTQNFAATNFNDTSALGADASMCVTFQNPPANAQTFTYVAINMVGGGGASEPLTGQVLLINPGANEFTAPAPTGGAKAGGAASSEYVLSGYSASGGVVAGGAATVEKNWSEAQASGGLKAGGSAPTEHYINLRGPLLRSVGTAAIRCGSGGLTVYIPATAQVGDLLVLYITSATNSASLHLYPSTPAGWNLLGGSGGQSGQFANTWTAWRYCQAGDAGAAVNITIPVDNATSSKIGRIVAFHKTSEINGAPLTITGTVFAGATPLNGSTYYVPHALPAVLGEVPHKEVNLVSSYNVTPAMTAEAAADGWSALAATVVSGCGFNDRMAMAVKDFAGSRASAVTITTSPYMLHTVPATGYYGIQTTAIYGVGLFSEATGSGGVKAGGAATTELSFDPGYLPSGGASVGGIADATPSRSIIGLVLREQTEQTATGSGDFILTIPANTEADDLLIATVALGDTNNNSYAIGTAPTGWNVAYRSNNDNLSASLAVWWRKAITGDADDALTVTFTGTATEAPNLNGKVGVVQAWRYADWSANGGNPFIGETMVTNGAVPSTGNIQAYLAPSPLHGNTTLTVFSSFESLTEGASVQASGWNRVADNVEATPQFSARLNIWQKYSLGIRASAVNQLYTMASGPAFSNAWSTVFSIACQTGFEARPPLGGSKIGGAADTEAALTPVDGFVASGGVAAGGLATTGTYYDLRGEWTAAGGLKSGGAGLAQLASYTKPAVYGLASQWAAEPVSASLVKGWVVTASVNDAQHPASMIVVRRTAGAVELNIQFPGTVAVQEGDEIGVVVVYEVTGAGSVPSLALSATASLVSVRGGFTFIVATASEDAGENAWTPQHVMMRAGGSLRASVDWYVKAGDTVEGVEIVRATTTLTAYAPWTTEVFFNG